MISSPVSHDVPITGTGDIKKDTVLTREKLKGATVLCKTGICLKPALYNLERWRPAVPR